jgi:predicted nicotinamide N-methyase
MPVDALRFVRAVSEPQRPGLVPEIVLHLARNPLGIFAEAEAREAAEPRLPPYWAFAWPAGQALARHILDHPALVAGRRVVDIGAGSGIAAIAALMAGAVHALAADVDPFAVAACRLNAAANAVEAATTTRDLLAAPPPGDVLLLGDVFYEPELEVRVSRFLTEARRRRARLLYADRAAGRRPPAALRLLAEYATILAPAMEEGHVERARVWELDLG